MLEKQQGTKVKFTTKKNPYEREIARLEEMNNDLKLELARLTGVNQKLRDRIALMGDAEKSYISSIRELEQKNASHITHSPQTHKSEDDKKSKSSRVYLINYD